MEPFKTFRGKLAMIDRSNIDTDAIIPKQFLKSIARTGFGPSLFFDWRYLPDGKPNPEFTLNQPRFQNASILVAGNNFGCGSSREHAVWAIQQYGFKAVVAARNRQPDGSYLQAFADIFKNNCSKNSLLTIELEDAQIREIFKAIQTHEGLEATVDLQDQVLTLQLPTPVDYSFEIDHAVKDRLIGGLDDIGITLKEEKSITVFESKHNPQLYR